MSEKKLVRSKEDRMVAGVAAGLGDYLNIDTGIARLLFVVFSLLGGPGLIIYIILWIVMPEGDNGAMDSSESEVDEEPQEKSPPEDEA